VDISQVKTWVNYGWIDDCSRSLNRNGILKLKNLLDPDPDWKILEQERSRSLKKSLQPPLLYISVEHDPLPDRKPTGFCNSEPDPDRAGFRNKLYLIRYGYPNYVDHCSQMLNQSFFFRYKPDRIEYLDSNTRLGSDWITQWKHWIGIAKISDPLKITLYFTHALEMAMDPVCPSRLRQDSAFSFGPGVGTCAQTLLKNRTRCQAKFLTSAHFWPVIVFQLFCFAE